MIAIPVSRRTTILMIAAFMPLGNLSAAPIARISEGRRVLTTYPFSEPNPIPILTRDARLYPYHTFEGYANDGVPRQWNVVCLENDLIKVFVLPEAGGKVWGAIVKRTGHEFIYRNEVMKFRNIAMRGPWTSGGIEFNFGVIGHTPSTATPVDYVLRQNPDGSASCFVGTMDLPSRTHWRVEIRLPSDRAYFETNVQLFNPTPLEQPYYHWMTAAAAARDDLEMYIPGNAYLEHSGARHDWPLDSAGRHLPTYANNRFAGHKSYHVVGELNDFFGGYYHDAGYGFGHWARYEDMPGQKLWLWALSREGGVWEDLLTDSDGQYIEFQAGRLFVQYASKANVNPISQVGFDPGATDRWSETWFPLEGLGGLSDASRNGAMYVRHDKGRLTISVHAFGDTADTLRIFSGGRSIASFPMVFSALKPVCRTIPLPAGADYRVELPTLDLRYEPDRRTRHLARPFTTDPSAWSRIPVTDRWFEEGRQAARARRYSTARLLFERTLTKAPWHRGATLGLANLEYRRGRYQAGLDHVSRMLQRDTYDANANFAAGNLYHALNRVTDAREAYGWAARAIAYRSAAYVQLAELALAEDNASEAARYARLALDYDRLNLPARQVLAMIGRKQDDANLAAAMRKELLDIDPLHHFAVAETYLANPNQSTARTMKEALRSEYPDQTILELAVDYARRGAPGDADALLRLGQKISPSALLRVWQGWLDHDTSVLSGGADPTMVFPFRRETLPVLRWATEHDDHWSWAYLLALNLWARDRDAEAATVLTDLGDEPDFAPFYVTRARLLERLPQRDPQYDPQRDLRHAVQIDGTNRTIRIQLIRHLQDSEKWKDALVESDIGRSLFPNDYDMNLLHVRSLNELDRPLEAIDILKATHVLPSENSGAGHQLYEQAHTLAALAAMNKGEYTSAIRHLRTALQWPEHLGQGRPYVPEERLVQYLIGYAEQQLGQADRARVAFQAVLDASTRSEQAPDRLDLLAIPAMAALKRSDAIPANFFKADAELNAIATELTRAIASGEDLRGITQRLATEHHNLFGDLDGRLLLQALLISP